MVRYFTADDPDYLCSFCGERIEEPDIQPDEWDPEQLDLFAAPTMRCFREAVPGDRTRLLEARFHQRCFIECLHLGIFEFRAKHPESRKAA